MLEFCYGGTIERSLFEKNCKDILMIADKYNIVPLKNHCEYYLAEALTIKNFTNWVIFADTYTCDVLMEECRKFLVHHYNQIASTREWIDMKRRNLTIVNELLEKALFEKVQHGSKRKLTLRLPT
jgi:hypothetical protein